MRLLVIGASGQLARSLAEARRDGVDVVVRGRPDTDLRVRSTLDRALDEAATDVVINAAAYTAVDRAEREVATAHAVNALGAGALASVCERYDAPLIHVSTDYVFDGSKHEPYVESDPPAPLNAYGRTKWEGERRAVDACTRIIVLRTSWLHGGHGKNFVTGMLQLARQRREIGVVADQRGCPTYAPHLARAIVAIGRRITATETPFTDWGTYHAAGSGAATWCDVATEVFAVADWLGAPAATAQAIATADYPTPARRPQNSRLDCSRLARVFGLALPDWRTGVALSVGEAVGASRRALVAA